MENTILFTFTIYTAFGPRDLYVMYFLYDMYSFFLWGEGGAAASYLHFFSALVCRVCGYDTSSCRIVHTYFRMPEYDFRFGLSYVHLRANYTVFHIWYVKHAGFHPPPAPLCLRPTLHWGTHFYIILFLSFLSFMSIFLKTVISPTPWPLDWCRSYHINSPHFGISACFV